MIEPAERLMRVLGYAFQRAPLLDQALTHCSVGAVNNERLEFLGDGVLNFVIASELFHLFPEAVEGQLSRLRAALVKRETLAELARGLQLGDYLRLGSGELKSGGFRRDSILADALEAILGAIYLDGGFDPCRDIILKLYRERLEHLDIERELKDPKTRLQEWLQGRRQALPEYEVIEIKGAAHNQSFKVSCTIGELAQTTVGMGNSRRRAEQDAARQALELLTGKP